MKFLIQPIPVLSDISRAVHQGDVTVTSLTGNPAIEAAANAILAINNLSLPAMGGSVNLGSLTCLDAYPGVSAPLTIMRSQLTAFAAQISSAFAGFEQQVHQLRMDFPILDDPNKLIQLITGQNVPLFSYSMPSVSYHHSWSQSFTFTTPLGNVELDPSVGFDLNVAASFRCDSSGLLTGHVLNSLFAQNVTCGLGFTIGLAVHFTPGIAGFGLGGFDLNANVTVQAALSLKVSVGSNFVTVMTGNASINVDADVWVGFANPIKDVRVHTFDLFHIHEVLWSF